jgi:hypothetical protein
MMRRAYSYAWWALLLLVLGLLLPDGIRGDSIWEGGSRFLCVFLLAKLWQRRSNSDYLQAYVASFLMLLSASLLGTSMVYAVCLLFYIVFSTWTLTLFHLRREMEENYLLKHLPGKNGQAAESERVEVERILNSRRVVGPPFLLTTAGAGLLTFLFALLLFVLLPRFHVTVDLPFHRRMLPSTGFSERLELGSHGLLRDNPRVVMRVELPGQSPPKTLRLRGVTFASYQNGRWSQHRVGEQPLSVQRGAVALALNVSESVRSRAQRAEIYLEPLDADALFTPSPGRALSLQVPESYGGLLGAQLGVTTDGQIIARGRRSPLHYSVLSLPEMPRESSSDDLGLYRQLSPEMRSRLRTLALQIVGTTQGSAERAELLSGHLQTNYSYTTRLWKPSQSEPIFDFLESERRGHCEYFATALAVLLRSLDIPSRTVNGYLTAEWNSYGKFFVVRQQHAHSWVEALLPGQGWVVLDPTPPQSSAPRLPFLFKIRQLLDGLDMGFGKYVLEYDVGAQQRLTDRLSSLWPRNEPARSERAQTNSGEWRRLLPIALLLGGLGLGLLLLVRRLRRVELPMTRDVTEGRGLMKLALSTVRKRGFVRGPGETLKMLAQRLTDEGDPCAPSFAQL